MSLRIAVAENLRTLRARKRLSQQAVARSSRISTSYVSMLEQGQRAPTLDTLEALAVALGVAPHRLLRER